MPIEQEPQVKEWLTKSEVAELTGLRVVTIASYASRGKWRRKTGEKRKVLFWYEDALRSVRKTAVWNTGFSSSFSALESERVKYKLARILNGHGVDAPKGVRVKVQVLVPILSDDADAARAPGAVKQIIFTRE